VKRVSFSDTAMEAFVVEALAMAIVHHKSQRSPHHHVLGSEPQDGVGARECVMNHVEHMVSCWASLPDGHDCSTGEPVSDDTIINHALKTYKGSASSEALSFRKLSLRVRWRAAYSVRSTSYFKYTHLRPDQVNGRGRQSVWRSRTHR